MEGIFPFFSARLLMPSPFLPTSTSLILYSEPFEHPFSQSVSCRIDHQTPLDPLRRHTEAWTRLIPFTSRSNLLDAFFSFLISVEDLVDNVHSHDKGIKLLTFSSSYLPRIYLTLCFSCGHQALLQSWYSPFSCVHTILTKSSNRNGHHAGKFIKGIQS